MRISEHFNLGTDQFGLDFINIDPKNDTPLYLSPFILRDRQDRWSVNSYRTIVHFFQTIIDLLKAGNLAKAQVIFGELGEPSENCLGVSRRGTDGAGVGPEYALEILQSIQSSGAVTSGLVKDLDDTIIFVDGVGRDRMSDMTTNIIRSHLIDYTIEQCNIWNIPLLPNQALGKTWNIQSSRWTERTGAGLVIDEKPILLVPKWMVTRSGQFTHKRFYDIPVRAFIQTKHQVRTGTFLTKDEIDDQLTDLSLDSGVEEFDGRKDFIRLFTLKHPKVFADFKSAASQDIRPLDHSQFDHNTSFSEVVDHIINTLNSVKEGTKDSKKYELVMAAALHIIFYSDLINPIQQLNIDNGRRIIDIAFENASKDGLFYSLADIERIPSAYVYVEVKNYSTDPRNPEVDQLNGRLSVRNGEIGILVSRKIKNMKLLIQRCHGLWQRQHHLIIPIEDSDIIEMLKLSKSNYGLTNKPKPYEIILRDRMRMVRH